MDFGQKEALVSPFCCGYLIADLFIFAIPHLSLEYTLHHILTLIIVLGGISGHNSIARFIPHMLVADLTQLLYNSSWLLRRWGWGARSHAVLCLEILFVLAFPLCRILVMPVSFLRVGTEAGLAKQMGVGRFALLPLFCLQLYWYRLVLKRVAGILRDKPKRA